MIQEELRAIVVAGGLTPSKTTYNQVNTALQKMYAPVIGTVRNLAMTVGTASATATVTADEIIVGGALGGQKYVLPSFNKSINLATVGVNAGVGGMDTGTAPVSGFVALYAIYNPTTQTAALLATNAATLQPSVYGGANMPNGYTASGLLTVVPTNASSQIVPCVVMDRSVDIVGSPVLSTSTVQASPTIFNNLVVPLNAKTCSGFLQMGNTAAGSNSMSVLSSSANTGTQNLAATLTASGSIACGFNKLKMNTAQRMYYIASSTAGTPSFAVTVNSYEI